MSCAICETRKEKRFCPAVHGRICPTCCGTEREVTLDCPSDCVYLQQARRYERPRQVADVEPAELFAQVNISEDLPYRREPLIVGLSQVMAEIARRDRTIRDRDLIAALTGLAKSYETLVNAGLVYEAPMASPVQHGIAGELDKGIQEYRDLEAKQAGHSTLRDSEVLQVVVFLLRLALSRSNGRARARAFIDFLFAQFPQKESLITGPEEARSRLILP
ncbi:MAG: hypothetical protein ACE14L_16965 [Terriglobales bacterium]